MSYIVKNCPAFVLMRTATSGTYFDMCGNAKGHIKCADCTDCVMKRVIGKCIELYNMECKNPYKTNGYMLAFDILKEMNIQEVE